MKDIRWRHTVAKCTSARNLGKEKSERERQSCRERQYADADVALLPALSLFLCLSCSPFY